MTAKTRVLFLIQSLASGGAERQLSELVRHMDTDRFEVHLAVYYDPGYHNDGKFWPLVEAHPGVKLYSLHKKKGLTGFLTAIPRLFKLARRIRPQVIHGYSDGNPLALLMGKLLGAKVVWGIRRTSSHQSSLNERARRLQKWLIRASHFVDLIIFNSEAGRINHAAMGMKPHRAEVVPNGFDVERFHMNPSKGAEQRQVWGVPGHVPLIGVVGRMNPVKDHPTFIRTAARLSSEWPDARFICIGGGPAAYVESLKAQAQALGIGDKVLFPGTCADMPAAYNALNLLILSSSDEGFPNALGEAMACGVPCVATRVGDAAVLLGNTGLTADIGDDEALAQAAATLLRESEAERSQRALASRQRVSGTFSLEALVQRTENSLLSLLASPQKDTRPKSLLWKVLGAGGRYLVRVDDICPTMDWAIWDQMEALFLKYEIKPILAVVPDNQDPKLMVDPPLPEFWDRVRGWQARGWSIGLHGYQHLYVNTNPGLLNLNPQSEFAGLSLEAQQEKLRRGMEIFEREGVRVDAWVAPSHSFDLVTVAALQSLGIRIISDGFAAWPYRDPDGNTWVPQQFATMRPLPFGVWTCCHHPDLTPPEMVDFERRLALLSSRMISLPQAIALGNRVRNPVDGMIRFVRRAVPFLRRLTRDRLD
ncbi:MAG TPA: DUF2334 domain-containing protein [Holophagaceae bacterium]|nr:DUF2334 domain-containing protein [Holophagaceae bacterium]